MTFNLKFASARQVFVAAMVCTALPFTHADIIYANGFDVLPLGEVSDADIKSAWKSRYAKGPDEGRVEIVSDAQTGQAARVLYPAFANQSSPSGATWETGLNVEEEALYLSYWVKVGANFDFVKGGKLPGLAGSTSFPYGDNRFTTRLMWREQGKLEFYVHGYQLPDSNGKEPTRLFWDDFGEHARLTAGQWHHIEIYQKLNTPGQKDGLLLGWLDGNLVAEKVDDAGVRSAGHGDTKLNYLYFSTFYGGSSAPVIQWQPQQDMYAVFDDFIVSTDRIGMVSFPGDVAAGTRSGSTSDSNPTDCQALSLGSKHEVDLSNGSCLVFPENLQGLTVAVWDSEVASCDFRGSLQAIDGSGSFSVSTNYIADSNLTGSQLRVSSNQSPACNQLMIRVM